MHPGVRVEEVGVRSIPIIANSVIPVPVLKDFGVVNEVLVFVPAYE